MYRNGPNESLHEKLAGEGEDDNIEAHKGKIAGSFAIILRCFYSSLNPSWDVGRGLR